jgi:hypothetical protein
MTDPNEKVLRQKENLATKALQLAEDALDLLQSQVEECSTRDLVVVFNAAVKTHREISSDIISLTEKDSKQEQELAKAYDGTVDKLLKKLNVNLQ